MMKVPASMRSGMMRCLAPFSLLTPFTRMVGVPAPSIFAPILLSRSARSATSGSRAQFCRIALALGEGRGHQQVFGAGDGDLVEDNLRAFEAIGRGLDVAVFLRDLRAEAFESLDVEIDGACADGASAGKRDASASAARDQRPEHQGRGAHGLDQFVGSFGRGEIVAVNAWCDAGRVRSRVRPRRPWRRAGCAWSECRGPAECFRG